MEKCIVSCTVFEGEIKEGRHLSNTVDLFGEVGDASKLSLFFGLWY